MTSLSAAAQNGQAQTTQKTFSRETVVSTLIAADAAIIWSLLTQVEAYSRWNSTIVSVEGTAAVGEKIRLKSTLDPSRTFKLKIKEMVPAQRMSWGDAMGTRTYTLEPQGDGQVRFTMQEKIGGLMFPLFANKIPSFDESFEQFAADLKKEAEALAN